MNPLLRAKRIKSAGGDIPPEPRKRFWVRRKAKEVPHILVYERILEMFEMRSGKIPRHLCAWTLVLGAFYKYK